MRSSNSHCKHCMVCVCVCVCVQYLNCIWVITVPRCSVTELWSQVQERMTAILDLVAGVCWMWVCMCYQRSLSVIANQCLTCFEVLMFLIVAVLLQSLTDIHQSTCWHYMELQYKEHTIIAKMKIQDLLHMSASNWSFPQLTHHVIQYLQEYIDSIAESLALCWKIIFGEFWMKEYLIPVLFDECINFLSHSFMCHSLHAISSCQHLLDYIERFWQRVLPHSWPQFFLSNFLPLLLPS